MQRARYGVREEVKGTADTFYRALSQKNVRAVEEVWAHVPYATVAGRSGQLQQGWERVRQYWQQRLQQLDGTVIKVKLVDMNCHAVGDVAWLSGTEVRTVTDGDGSRVENLRVTCVMERQGTSWQIVSYHASLPRDDSATELANAS